MAFLSVDGAALHYRVQGGGVPVIALHGSASTGAQWRSLIGCLEGRFTVVTPDLPGYGASHLANVAGGLGGDAAAVEALVEAIGGPVHLVGHSYGGAVALKLAARRPGAVRSLTVIEPTAFNLLRDGGRQDRALHAEVAALAAAIVSSGREAAMARFIDYWNGPGAWSHTSPRLQSFLLGCLDRVRFDYRSVWAESGNADRLRRIGAPALVIAGTDTPAPGLRTAEIVSKALPRAVLRTIPDAGHLVPLTDPHVVDPMIAAHLLAADRPGAAAELAA